MKKLIQKDKKRRNLVYKFENIRFVLKSIIKNKNIYCSVRWNAILKLSSLPKNSSITRFSNRCILTGRKSGIIKKFKLSRLSFLKLSRLGQISGIKKSTN